MAYFLLAAAGLGGDLAWTAALFLAPALVVVELLAGLADRRTRRLEALAARALPVQSLAAPEREALQAGLLALPGRTQRRVLWVWGLAVPLFLPVVIVGFSALLAAALGAPLPKVSAFPVSWGGMLLVLAAGLPPAVLLPRLVLDLRLRRALPYFDLGADPAAVLAPWLPSLAGRVRRALLAPLVVALAPLLALALLGQAAEPGTEVAAAALGLLAVAACAAALRSAVEEPLDPLGEALQRLAQGETVAALAVADAGLLGRLVQDGRAALKAVAGREQAWRHFGGPPPPGADPVVQSGLRPVAVLALRWQGVEAALRPLAPLARLRALKRVALVFEKAVGAQGGWVLEASPGRWVAVWGAPWPLPEPGQGALAAAWALRSLLPVLAQQGRLRDGFGMDWGLGMASGQAACGLGGAQGGERFSLQGGPLDEALVLAVGGGPWLDERSAGAAKSPFAATLLPQGLQLTQGPDVQVLPGLGLGFEPGQRL